MRIAIAAILGGIVMFLWGAVAHTMLPLGELGMHTAVEQDTALTAIGDKAIDWVVDTYAQALATRPTRGLRHGIIHANTPTDRAIGEMARLQRRAARVGFDWPDARAVQAKIVEEAAELAQETDPDRVEDEFGDLLIAQCQGRQRAAA